MKTKTLELTEAELQFLRMCLEYHSSCWSDMYPQDDKDTAKSLRKKI